MLSSPPGNDTSPTLGGRGTKRALECNYDDDDDDGDTALRVKPAPVDLPPNSNVCERKHTSNGKGNNDLLLEAMSLAGLDEEFLHAFREEACQKSPLQKRLRFL